MAIYYSDCSVNCFAILYFLQILCNRQFGYKIDNHIVVDEQSFYLK